ncbi:MAG: hypothetical protein E7240_01785 [Lachnospiraceae bacterium]|nr:hypothetical protein [Lachnospiraceae bacterium]
MRRSVSPRKKRKTEKRSMREHEEELRGIQKMGKKKRWGDRRDATLVRETDGLHFVMPIIYPGRCNNEAFINLTVDLTETAKYLDYKNANNENPDFRYTLFHVIVTAAFKVFTLMPWMNKFIQNKNIYQRDTVSAGFVVRKRMEAGSTEGGALLFADPDDTIVEIRQKLYKVITTSRSDEGDASANSADILQKLPRFVGKAVVEALVLMDRFGKAPSSMVASDPYQASIMLTNLGSVGLDAGYHHLTEWGTNSFFVIIGKRGKHPFYEEDGTVTMKDSIELGLTIDERIGDGYMFSQAVKLFEKMIAHPEYLDRPLKEEID